MPGRTISGAFTDVHQADTGNPTSLPSTVAAGETVAAIVAMQGASTGFMTFPGNLTTSGTFTIPGVPPTGHYFFAILPPSPPAHILEMSGSAPDLSRVLSTRVDLVAAGGQTRAALAVTNLDSWATGDHFTILSSQAGVDFEPSTGTLAAGATQFNHTAFWSGGLADASKSDVVYFLQAVAGTAGTGTLLANTTNVTKCTSLSNLTLANGGTTNAAVALTAAPQTGSVQGSMKFSQFDALAASVNPNAKSSAFLMEVFSEPHSVAYPDHPFTGSAGLFGLALTFTAPPADTDYGTLVYGQCLDPLWKEKRNVSYQFTVPIAGTTIASFVASVSADEPMTPAPGAVAPVIGPVKSPQIAGKDAFTAQSGVTVQPAFSWTAPAVGTASSYTLEVFNASTQAAVFAETVYGTSLTVPPGLLSSGTTYFAVITSRQAAFDTLDAAPLREGTPVYSAQAVTAAFTP
jgi:hypothetical protein